MPAWLLKLWALLFVAGSLFGSFSYASAHVKNAAAPLQPPVPDAQRFWVEDLDEFSATIDLLPQTATPSPTPTPTPTPTPRASATPVRSGGASARTAATPSPTLAPTRAPTPAPTFSSGVKVVSRLPAVTYTHSS